MSMPDISANAVQVAKLRAYHYTAQTKPEKAALARYGLDLVKGVLINNVEAGVIEPVLSKIKMIQVSRCSSIIFLLCFLLTCQHLVMWRLSACLRNSLQFATEAAITILRIDDMITIDASAEDEMEG